MYSLANFSNFYNFLGLNFFSQLKVSLATHCWRWAIICNPSNQTAIENFRFLGHLNLDAFIGDNPLGWLHQAPRQEDWIAKSLLGKTFADSASYEQERAELLKRWEETPRLELKGKSPLHLVTPHPEADRGKES
jgi:hypothetical protein